MSVVKMRRYGKEMWADQGNEIGVVDKHLTFNVRIHILR